jgi:uncharacterized protein
MTERPPRPPFDLEGALAEVQAAEDAWNTRRPSAASNSRSSDRGRSGTDQAVTWAALRRIR